MFWKTIDTHKSNWNWNNWNARFIRLFTSLIHFHLRHKLLWNVWCRRRPSGSLSLRVSVVFKVIPHIHPVPFFSHIYILLLISYNSYKRGVVSWMVTFFATEIWDLRLMERCSLRSMLTMRILPNSLWNRNWNIMLSRITITHWRI